MLSMGYFKFLPTVSIVMLATAIPVGWTFYYMNMPQEEALDWISSTIDGDEVDILSRNGSLNTSTSEAPPIQENDTALYLFSLMSSITSLGAFIGAIIASITCTKFGRKPTLLGIAIFNILGVVLFMTSIPAHSVIPMLVGRTLNGCAMGGSDVALAMYLFEVSSMKHRSIVSTSFVGVVYFGLIAMYVCTIEQTLGHDEAWWIPYGFVLLPISLFLFTYHKIPESPIWLRNQGRFGEAKLVQHHLYPKGVRMDMRVSRADIYEGVPQVDDISGEIHVMEQSTITWQEESFQKEISTDEDLISEERRGDSAAAKKLQEISVTVNWQLIKKDSNFHKAFIYVTIFCLADQFSGILILQVYSQRLISSFDVSKLATQLINVGLAIICLAGGWIGSWAAGKWQRKAMMLTCYSVVALANLGMFVLGLIETEGMAIPISEVVLFCLALFFGSLGVTNLKFVIPGEILPIYYKTIAQSYIMLSTNLIGFIQLLAFPKIEVLIGSYVFLIFFICNLITVIYFFFRTIETKGIESVETFENFSKRKYL